ncbi:hypothetical protein HK101_002864, partial [Irineochytrium annulatum]
LIWINFPSVKAKTKPNVDVDEFSAKVKRYSALLKAMRELSDLGDEIDREEDHFDLDLQDFQDMADDVERSE